MYNVTALFCFEARLYRRTTCFRFYVSFCAKIITYIVYLLQLTVIIVPFLSANCPDLNFRPTFMYTTQINRKREAGVVFCNGDLWKQTRRFGLTVLRDLGFGRKFIEAKITHEFDYVRDEISSFGGRAFDINNLLNRATCNVISIFCFGHRFDYHDDKFKHLMTMLNEGFRTSQGGARELGNFWRIFRFLPLTKTTKKMARNFSDTHDWIKNEIELQRATFSADNKSNLVDLYLMYEKGLIDESEKPETKLEAYDLQFLISDLFIAGRVI